MHELVMKTAFPIAEQDKTLAPINISSVLYALHKATLAHLKEILFQIMH